LTNGKKLSRFFARIFFHHFFDNSFRGASAALSKPGRVVQTIMYVRRSTIVIKQIFFRANKKSFRKKLKKKEKKDFEIEDLVSCFLYTIGGEHKMKSDKVVAAEA
jgi:hypothetical protein